MAAPVPGRLVGPLGVLMILEEKWPVLARHERALARLRLWVDLGHAPRTLDAYARGLAEYLAACDHAGVDPLTATRAQVASYVRELRERPSRRGGNAVAIDSGSGLANATIQQRLVPVRLFYDFLVEEGLRESNPVGRGRYTPGQRRSGHERGLVPRLSKLPWLPSEAQWNDVLQGRPGAGSQPTDARAGLRRGAAARGAVQPAYRRSRSGAPDAAGRAETTKNRRGRVVPYSAATGVLLSHYLAHRATFSRARGPLFLSESRRNYAQPLTLWTWSKVVHRIAGTAELSQFSLGSGGGSI